MEDWYRILGVKPSASAAEIKRAFRLRAKALHPDIPANAADRTRSEEQMRELLRAWEVLSDISLRSQYDTVWAASRGYTGDTVRESTGFDYRMWLLARNDTESRAKLIFFDLLHGFEDAAVAEYLERRTSPGGFTLSRYFDREDFMDCGFILAEELSFRNEFYEAFLLLSEVIHMEWKKPYFRHFFPEAVAFTRDIVRTKIALQIPDELALDCFETALELRFGKKDDAFILKLMSGCYLRIGDRETARLCLLQALKFDPALTGIRDLKKALEV
ncbi:MAG TPA: J domain-containing protein [Treponemataceae bacterium]|nr:MAG: Chaperone protein DnaJ [Spirochaetes bacterium ADurb.Bin269]TAH54761.1 MAG: molecular chaperone DnaJ [Treponema sp.]HOC28531.1 J domain-containing protein [Treponemataceae bacterium]HQL31874.1 J domain-containing protein [Treponemataceae bacterium]